MFKKVSQVSNGGSTTITHNSNISSRSSTAPYLMEIKPIIFNCWYILLHNDCSQADLESILFPYFRSIPCLLKWLEDVLLILRTMEGASQQEVMMLENPTLLSKYLPFNILKSSSGGHVKTLRSTLKAEYDQYQFAFYGGVLKVITTSGLNLKIKHLFQKVRLQHLALEYLSIPKFKSFSADLRMIGHQDKVVTEIATDSVSVPLTLTPKHMPSDGGGGLPLAKDIAYADDLIVLASRADSSQFTMDDEDSFCLRFGLKLEWPIQLKDEVDWLME